MDLLDVSKRRSTDPRKYSNWLKMLIKWVMSHGPCQGPCRSAYFTFRSRRPCHFCRPCHLHASRCQSERCQRVCSIMLYWFNGNASTRFRLPSIKVKYVKSSFAILMHGVGLDPFNDVGSARCHLHEGTGQARDGKRQKENKRYIYIYIKIWRKKKNKGKEKQSK